MNNSVKILAAVKRSFNALLTELKNIWGLGSEEPSPDMQLLVNRVLSGAVVLVAVIFCFLPGEVITKRTVANALFSAATWLWTGKEHRADA